MFRINLSQIGLYVLSELFGTTFSVPTFSELVDGLSFYLVLHDFWWNGPILFLADYEIVAVQEDYFKVPMSSLYRGS